MWRGLSARRAGNLAGACHLAAFVSLLLLLPALAWPRTWFEPNRGQTPEPAAFLARTGNHVAAISARSLKMPGGAIAFEGSSRSAHIEALDRQPGVSHYALHRDPSRWIYDVPHYGAALARGVYPGIDVRYHDSAAHDRLEFDFEIAPHADPERISLAFDSDIQLQPDGGLLAGAIGLQRPRAWQMRGGERREVRVSFHVRGDRRANFDVGAFDPSLPLVVDPVIDFATYLGGSNNESDTLAITDAAGYIYMAGSTVSADFPAAFPGPSLLNVPVVLLAPDMYVTRLEPDASAIDWSFFIGGIGSDRCGGLAQDSLGNIYVLGASASPDFPVTAGAWRTTISLPGDEVLVKLDAQTGHVKASTFLGLSPGSGLPLGALAVDSAGGAYVAGLPASTFQPTAGAYLTKAPTGSFALLRLNPGLSAVAWATWVDTGRISKMQVDSAGSVVFGGNSANPAFPAVNPIPGIAQTQSGVYIAKMNPTGSALTFASELDGNYARDAAVMDLRLDPAGNVWVAGLTSDPQFPVVNPVKFDSGSAAKPTENVWPSTFLAVLPPGGGPYIQSTFLYGPTYTVNAGSPDPAWYQIAFAGGRACVAGLVPYFQTSLQTPGGLGPDSSQSFTSTLSGSWLQCLDAANTHFEFRTALPYTGGQYNSMAATPDGALIFAGTSTGALVTTAAVAQPQYGGGDYSQSGYYDPTAIGAADAFLLRVSLSNPAPVVSGATPDTFVLGGQGKFSLTLLGGGFAYGEQVTINGQPATASWAAPNQLSIGADISVLTPGPNTVTVTMPAPGGGTAGPVTITALNPAPAGVSITPSQVDAGAAETKVVISGSSLLPNSVIGWNGAARNGTYVTAANTFPSFQLLLEPAELAQPSNSTVTVTNPAPGGGVSAPLHFIVQGSTNVIPTVTGPVALVASPTPPKSITVSGTGFSSSTQVFWDGAPIPTTFNSATSLAVSAPASDLSILGAHDLYAANGNLASSPIRVYIGGQMGFLLQTTPVYSPGGNRLFVLYSQFFTTGTVQKIYVYDTTTGATLLNIPVSFSPILQMAASDDGRYLYLAGGQSKLEITRLNVASQSFDLDWQVTPPPLSTAALAAILPVPGSPETVIAALSYQTEITANVDGVNVSGGMDVVIFDRDQPRFLRASELGLNLIRITPGGVYQGTPVFATANRVLFQGVGGQGSGVLPCFMWADFDGAGVEGGDASCTAQPRELVFDHTVVYLTDGRRAVVPTGFSGAPQSAPALVDPVARKVYSYTFSQLTSLDLNTLVSTITPLSSGLLGNSGAFFAAPGGILAVGSNLFFPIPEK